MWGRELPFQIGCSGYTSLRDLFRALKEVGASVGKPGGKVSQAGRGSCKGVVQRPGWEVVACLRSCEKAGATGVEWGGEHGCGEV